MRCLGYDDGEDALIFYMELVSGEQAVIVACDDSHYTSTHHYLYPPHYLYPHSSKQLLDPAAQPDPNSLSGSSKLLYPKSLLSDALCRRLVGRANPLDWRCA